MVGLVKATALTQIHAMIWIRLMQTLRDKKFLFTGLFLPFMTILLCILLNHLLKFTPPPNSFTMLSNLPENSTIAYIPSSQENVTLLLNEMKLIYNVKFVEFVNQTELQNAILNNTIENISFGLEFPDDSPLSLQNINPIIYYNQSQILTQITKALFNCIYKLVNHQTLEIDEFYYIITTLSSIDIFPKLAPLLIQYGYIFILPYFSIILIVDRDKGIKNHLFLNSLRNSVYWSSHFLSDYLIYLMPAIAGWATLSIAKVEGVYNNGLSFVLFLTYGLQSIPFAFIVQFLFEKEETANKWLYPIFSIVTSVPTILASFVSSSPLTFTGQAPLSILPSYSLYSGLFYLIQQQDQIKYIILIQIGAGIFYSGIIILIEKFKTPKTHKIDDIENKKLQITGDEDVFNEINKIQQGTKNKDNQYILINGAYKQFIEDIPTAYGEDKKKSVKNAVDGIWLGVERGETFGLLGVNGAGKTTLLSICTNILKADEGEVFLRGKDTGRDPTNAFASVASCPQFDILFDNLTVSEHLRFFSWIKGVPKHEQQAAADRFIEKFDISDHKNKKSKDLSGGTKRKLSVAISLIGGSSIVFMDEPTTSLDPVSRRQLWSLINELKSDKAIILTTHSIEEADSLCNRVAIMVNGRLSCIGTPNHLKVKYGSGYQLDIEPITNEITQNRPLIDNYIRQLYPTAKPIERMGSTMSYEIPIEDISLSRVFREIEEKKYELGIKDFSLSQSSLEKVFLKLANLQTSNDDKENIKIVPNSKRKSILDLFK
ncbi:ABC transporter A family protein [Tieghemostelium lacteum]|uniref:ABC transporter A family protein n=1 Tax=Tieghemostelium lacteum TaxID=361077 RepID=A0A151ZIG2_TIELA|nr:ABC transporter A family protein [Tieghemostelium lacteum]|eukprot:KYQ93670.1 ABC transporter A family protein [Tieghemostelium lacteum]